MVEEQQMESLHKSIIAGVTVVAITLLLAVAMNIYGPDKRIAADQSVIDSIIKSCIDKASAEMAAIACVRAAGDNFTTQSPPR